MTDYLILIIAFGLCSVTAIALFIGEARTVIEPPNTQWTVRRDGNHFIIMRRVDGVWIVAAWSIELRTALDEAAALNGYESMTTQDQA